MSFPKLQAFLDLPPSVKRELTPSERIVLFLMAYRHNADKDIAWPTHALIGHDGGISRSRVTRHMNSLIDKGYLEVVGTKRTTGQFSALLYKVHIPLNRDLASPAEDAEPPCRETAHGTYVDANRAAQGAVSPRGQTDPIKDSTDQRHEKTCSGPLLLKKPDWVHEGVLIEINWGERGKVNWILREIVEVDGELAFAHPVMPKSYCRLDRWLNRMRRPGGSGQEAGGSRQSEPATTEV